MPSTQCEFVIGLLVRVEKNAQGLSLVQALWQAYPAEIVPQMRNSTNYDGITQNLMHLQAEHDPSHFCCLITQAPRGEDRSPLAHRGSLSMTRLNIFANKMFNGCLHDTTSSKECLLKTARAAFQHVACANPVW